MLVLVEKIGSSPAGSGQPKPKQADDLAAGLPEPVYELALTADERRRSRHRFDLPSGEIILMRLPRGTVLADGDYLRSATGQIVRILAQPEPILVATAQDLTMLLRAAYHLGNRHVLVEVGDHAGKLELRLNPDPVLRSMLQGLGLRVTTMVAPFHPEAGAYSHHSHPSP